MYQERAAELMWDYRNGSHEQRMLSDLAVKGNPLVWVCDDCGNLFTEGPAASAPRRFKVR